MSIIWISDVFWGHRGHNVFFMPRDMDTEKMLEVLFFFIVDALQDSILKNLAHYLWANLAFFQKVAGPLLQRSLSSCTASYVPCHSDVLINLVAPDVS